MAKPVRISAPKLKSWLDTPDVAQSLAIVDVRDEDRFGVSPSSSSTKALFLLHAYNIPLVLYS